MEECDPAIQGFRILKDEPLFHKDKGLETGQDAFDHRAYAEAAFRIICDNHPPLSLGLFGPWGIGKSTVVNALFHLIRNSKDCRLRPVYFNAWKYSGDSFRRQFLIRIAEQVYEEGPEKQNALARLRKLNHNAVLRETEDNRLSDKIKGLIKDIRITKGLLLRLVLLGTFVVAGVIVYSFSRSIKDLLITAMLGFLSWLLPKKLEDVVVIRENADYDPQLIFPEQFEEEFKRLVSPAGPLRGARAVIAIDDIDRCDAATIRDVLTSIKTFLGEQHCYFVVPCDDESIIRVFDDPNQQEGYRSEVLRKYFNLGIRMSPLLTTDLVDLANTISQQTRIPQRIVQMAVLANCHDARKMKHFLNTFVGRYAVAKSRAEKGLMPVSVDENIEAFGKVVLLEDLYPKLFDMMVEQPEIYELLEKAALGSDAGDRLERVGLADWERDFPGLRDVMRRTQDVKIEHIELFISLKTSNPVSRIPRGFELRNAIVKGDPEVVDEIARNISEETARSNVAEMLINLLGRSQGPFLRNVISASLHLHRPEGPLLEPDRSRVARSTCSALLRKDGQKVLSHPTEDVLACAKEADAEYLTEMLDKYDKELSSLDSPPSRLAETVQALVKCRSDRIASVVNRKLEDWAGREQTLEALAQLAEQADVGPSDHVPSPDVVRKIAYTIAPEADDNTLRANRLREKVVSAYWNDDFAPLVSERVVGILSQVPPPETAESSRVAFAMETLLAHPMCLRTEHSPQLWPQVHAIYLRTPKWEAKFLAYKVVVLFALVGEPPNVRNAANGFVIQTSQGLADQQLREALAYIDTGGEPSKTEMKRTLVKSQFTLAGNERQNPSDRTIQRFALCFDNRELLGNQPLEQYLLSVLDAPESALDKWRDKFAGWASGLGSQFAPIAAGKILDLAGQGVSQQKRLILMEIFADLLDRIDGDKKLGLAQRYFDLCKHPGPDVRNSAVGILARVRGAVEPPDFKLGINALARDLFAKAPAEVPIYTVAINAVMHHSDAFGEYEWRDVGALSKRLMQQNNDALRAQGLSLVEQMTALPRMHEDDLVRQLSNMAKGSSGELKQRAQRILDGPRTQNLGHGARKTLQDYRKSRKKD